MNLLRNILLLIVASLYDCLIYHVYGESVNSTSEVGRRSNSSHHSSYFFIVNVNGNPGECFSSTRGHLRTISTIQFGVSNRPTETDGPLLLVKCKNDNSLSLLAYLMLRSTVISGYQTVEYMKTSHPCKQVPAFSGLSAHHA